MHLEQEGQGTVDVTMQDLKDIVANFRLEESRGRSKPVPIDISHRMLDQSGDPTAGRAFGWLTDMVIEGSALWGIVEWTEEGAALTAGRAFRFSSPVILWGLEDTATGEIRKGAYLHSVSLTNQPLSSHGIPLAASRDAHTALETDMAEQIETNEDNAENTDGLVEAQEKITALEAELEALKADKEKADATIAEVTAAKDEAEKQIAASRDPDKVTLSREDLTELQVQAKAGSDAAEKLIVLEATTRIDRAVAEGRFKPSEITDELRKRARDEAEWGLVLSLRAENSAWNTRVVGHNDRQADTSDNPRREAANVIAAYGKEKSLEYHQALPAALNDRDFVAAHRETLEAAGMVKAAPQIA